MQVRFLANVRFPGSKGGGVTPLGDNLYVEWTQSLIAEGYYVQLSDDGESWQTVYTANAGEFYYLIENVGWNIRKFVRVLAFNDLGIQGEALPPMEVWMPPQYPPTNLTATDIQAHQATLSFDLPSEVPANGAYLIQYRILGADTWEGNIRVSDPEVTIEDLQENTDYEFRIFSYNENGSEETLSPSASTISLKTLPETDPLQIVSAIVNPDAESLTIYFNDPVFAGVDGWNDFILNFSRGAIVSTYLDGDGTDAITYALDREVINDEICEISYVQPGDGIKNEYGTLLESFSDFEVINDSAQGVFDISEDFENALDSPGWVRAGSTTWKDTTNPIEGTGSFSCAASGSVLTPVFKERDKFYCFFKVRLTSAATTGNRYRFTAYDKDGSYVLRWICTQLYLSSLDVGGTVSGNSINMPNGEDLCIWIDYDAKTGHAEFRYSLDETRPVDPLFSVTSPTMRNKVVQFRLNHPVSGNGAALYDHVRCSQFPIGSSPD